MRPTIKGFSPDCLKEIISIVASHIRKDEGPAPLSMAYINKLVPQGQQYLKGLVTLGIIVRSGQFIPGQVCYHYDFAPAYKSKFLSMPLNNAKLVLRIHNVWDDVNKEAKKTIRGHSEQTKYLKKKILTIEDSCLAFIETSYATETEQYNFVLGSATRIMNGDIRYKIDNTSGRFHSNVTNMARALRPYLRVKGEPLINIDVRNSQPYLTTIILTNPGKVSWLTENPAFALLLQNLKVSLNEDVKKYISLVVSGQIYEHLMNQFLLEGIVLTRDEVKRQVLRILFARNRLPKDETNRKCRLIFKREFPTVHRIFSKVRGRERGDKFQNFKRFAILLQRIESYLMLDVVLKRIYKELPGVIAITIHDSIMTGILTNKVEAVRQILLDELTNFVGFQPEIKIEGNEKDKEGIEGEGNIERHYVITSAVNINNSIN